MQQDETDWWFDEVERTFGFLERDLGLRLVKRHRHHEGNFVI